MKKILVKNDKNEVIDESGVISTQEDVDFFISQRPQYICEVVDVSTEVEAEKAKEEKKKNFKFKGKTIAELREEMNEWVEMQK